MIAKIESESICKIETFNEKEEDNLEELIYEMYLSEKKEKELSKEAYEELVTETLFSIINNEHESSFIEEDYLIVTPKYGLGVVEIPIRHIDITL